MCRWWSKHRPAVRAELGSYAPQRLAFAEILKDNWAANVLAQVTDATTVITTNYDNLAERILSCRPGLTHQRDGKNCPHCHMCRLLLAYHVKSRRALIRRRCGARLKDRSAV